MVLFVVGSPIFLVKTHLQTSSTNAALSVGYQHRHGSMIQAFKYVVYLLIKQEKLQKIRNFFPPLFLSFFRNIYRNGGVTGLWQGATASIPRIRKDKDFFRIFPMCEIRVPVPYIKVIFSQYCTGECLLFRYIEKLSLLSFS